MIGTGPPVKLTASRIERDAIDPFAMTIQQFEHWSLILGVGGLILYMIFIIYRLGKESNAGKFGLFVLFIALGLGLFGFIAKEIIVYLMSRQ